MMAATPTKKKKRFSSKMNLHWCELWNVEDGGTGR
jgi:hypothetical protein